MLLRSALALASPEGLRGRLSLLIFHRVLAQTDEIFPGEIDAARFDRICAWLRRWFNVLPLTEAIARLKAGTLPSRALAMTFDDGYEDNHRVALPILRRHGLTATFFIATGFLDGGRMWNDTIIEAIRLTEKSALDLSDLDGAATPCAIDTPALKRTAIDLLLSKARYLPAVERQHWSERIVEQAEVEPPRGLMLTSDQVRDLWRNGMQIGAHTVSHPILAKLDDDEAMVEMEDSKRHLEELLGAEVGLFAYPNGRPGDDYSDRDVRCAEACGFAAALSTAWGAAGPRSDLYQLPRFTPWDSTRGRFGARLLGNLLRS